MFFAALPKADGRLAFAWWAVVLLHGILPALFAIAMGVLVGRGAARRQPRPAPLVVVGVIFVLLQVLTPIQTAVSHNLGDRTAAFLYDRLTEACVRPQGMAHLEDPSVDRRPDGRARLRSRHDRPAAVVLDGLHRRRAGRHDRRPGRGGRALRVRVVGAARARRRMAGDALAAARERRLARSQHRRSAQRPARRRLRVSAGRRSAGQQGAAAVRPGRLDDRSIHRTAHAASPAAVRGDAPARAAARVEPAARHRRQRHRALGAGVGGRGRPHRPRRAGRSTRSARSARR